MPREANTERKETTSKRSNERMEKRQEKSQKSLFLSHLFSRLLLLLSYTLSLILSFSSQRRPSHFILYSILVHRLCNADSIQCRYAGQ